jgi:MFS family permease
MMSEISPNGSSSRLTGVQWLICIIAAIGFAFDIYELLMMPLIARPALSELLHVDPDTDSGFKAILAWNTYIMWGSALCGGTFGLLGGFLTDLLGRRRVLTWSILLYAFSALAAGFSTSAAMLLILRCTTFIGVCVEFVAAVAWLAELFPDAKRREAVLGYTQAFSSVGGLLVTVAYGLCNTYAADLPAIMGEHTTWRYTLISGVIPALPLIFIRPFLPESPIWQQRRAAGTLKRPTLTALFAPEHARTSVVTALLFACSYGAAFGAIQFTPQIVPGLNKDWAPLPKLRNDYEKAEKGSPEAAELKKKIVGLNKDQQDTVKSVQLWQEFGGLFGRFALAWLAVRIVGRGSLLRLFQIPGLIIIPLVFFFPAAGKVPESVQSLLHTDNLGLLKIGIFVAGFLTVAQFSFWGNYLPRAYPVHLRGTGESFAANVGGRMFGTAANALTGLLFWPMLQEHVKGMSRPGTLAYAAAATALIVYAVGVVASFWLPEPSATDSHD